MIIAGRNAVYEALNSELKIEKILALKHPSLSKILLLAAQKNIKIVYTTREILNREGENNQGVIAYAAEYEYCDVEDILQVAKQKQTPHFILILSNIQDVHNLGSIIRVAECLGVDGIIIPKNNACGVNQTVMRISAGSAVHIKIAKVTNINVEIDRLKEQNIWVYGAEADGENLYQTDLTGNIAIVIGSEGEGIAPLTKRKCDRLISIPMKGKVNSLNASVACGIVLAEINRTNSK